MCVCVEKGGNVNLRQHIHVFVLPVQSQIKKSVFSYSGEIKVAAQSPRC